MLKEAILITVNGEEKKVFPTNKKKFVLKELQDFVGGTIDVIRFPDGRHMIVNDEGTIMDPPLDVNEKASEIFRQQFPIEKYPHNNDGTVVGDVLISCP